MIDRRGDGHGSATPVLQDRFRPELEGLRALAVVLVVAYHVWFGRVSGGVDVFFLVTGFLLTGQLYRAAAAGTLDLPRRWARSAARLLPMACTVLVATVVAGVFLLPESRWAQTVREVVASAAMMQNWRLAADAVDYAARGNTTSVVQHFWSLSIQVQFLVLWPLVVSVVVLAGRRTPHLLLGRLTLAALALFAASFWFSVRLTAQDHALAYFHTLTRLWEFALGALLALLIDRIVLPRAARIVLGWVGVLGLLVCGAVLDASAFPGFAALWPTACAALVLVAGVTGSRAGVDRLLVTRPARYLGTLSFALYLWHWPVLMLYLSVTGRGSVGLPEGLAIVAASLVLAVLSHHLVERPLGRARPALRTRVRWCAAMLIAVLAATAAWQLAAAYRAAPATVAAVEAHPGARALAGAPVVPAPLAPPPVTVAQDWVHVDHWDCAPTPRVAGDVCSQPVAAPPAKRVIVVGDSHAQQLVGMLTPIAERRGWQLVVLVRGACPFSTVPEVAPDDADCASWLAGAADEIADLRPDVVVTLATRDVRAGLTEQLPPGFVEQWARLDALGIPVLAVRDNPRFPVSMPECVERNGRDSPACGAARDSVYGTTPPWADAFGVPGNVHFLDIADVVCDPLFCPAEIGNVLVYMDDNHLSATYAATMADVLEDSVAAVVEG